MFPIVPSHIANSGRSHHHHHRSANNGSDRHIPANWTMTAWTGPDTSNSSVVTGQCSTKTTTKSHKKFKPNEEIASGCFSAVNIPKDSKTNLFELFDEFAHVPSSSEVKNQRYTISISTKGYLQCYENRKLPDSIWIKQMRLSNDVHSNNCLLELTPEKMLRLRTLCNVNDGNELVLWFSEDILALMFIPFLTPANIRGEYYRTYRLYNNNECIAFV